MESPVLTANANCSGIIFIPEGLRSNKVFNKESVGKSSSFKDINGEMNASIQRSEKEETNYSESEAKTELLAVSCSHCGTSKSMTPDQVATYYSVASFCKEQLDLCKEHYCILLFHFCGQTFHSVYLNI